MLAFMFAILFVIDACLMIGYYRTLIKVVNIVDEQQVTLKFTMLSGSVTVMRLLNDFKFFWALVTGSYSKFDLPLQLERQLDIARRYILLQYPLIMILFCIPYFAR